MISGFKRPDALSCLVYLIAFLGAMGNPIVLPALPFIMDDLHLTPMQIGMMISIYALPGAVILPFYGMLSDRLGRSKFLLSSLILCVLGSMLCAGAQNFALLLLGRALQGLSITPLDAMCFTLATDLFEGKKRIAMVERCTTMQFFSVTIVPLALAAIIPCFGWRSAFLLAAVIGASAFVMSLPVKMPYQPAQAQKISLFLAGVVQILLSKRMLGLFAVRILVAVIIFGVVYPHLSLLMVQKLSFPPETVGPMFTLYALGMFLGSLALPRLNRRMPEKLLGIIGGAMLLCAVALLASAASLAAIGTGLLCVGAGSGLLITQNTAHVSMAATPETHGTTMSAYSTIFRLGQSIAPGMMGCIFAAGNFSGLFASAAVLALVTGIVSSLAFSYAGKQESAV